MTAARGLSLLMFGVALLASSCQQGNSPRSVTEVVQRAEKVVLYEGLPHQLYEGPSLENERQTKAVQELDGYTFYEEPLALAGDDTTRLSEILGDSKTYKPFTGEKKCGGFHPDYAVEWHIGADRNGH